jgi:hypothetical protein
MVLAAGTPPERGAACGVDRGNPGEDGERRGHAREREDRVIRLLAAVLRTSSGR